MLIQIRQSLTEKMNKSLTVLKEELNGLRTNKSSINVLSPVLVESYGQKVKISQIATISTPDSRTITIQVWDRSQKKAVEKAITEANLGLNPISEDNNLIRINMPILSQERRLELKKLAHKYGETNKISIRNIRREGTDIIKKLEKEKTISEDEGHKINHEIQKLTDKFIEDIDQHVKGKEKELLEI